MTTKANGYSEIQPKSNHRFQYLFAAASFTAILCGAAFFSPRFSSTARFFSKLESTPLNGASAEKSSCILPESGPVLAGYDLVEYWNLNSGDDGVVGSAEFSVIYEDYTFYFSSKKNMHAFEANPISYLPKWGGFCGYGISEETWWTKSTLGPDANPNVWTIIDDYLFFFMFDTPETKFMTGSISAEIISGDTRWRNWFNGTTVLNTGCFWYNKTSD